MSSIYAKFIAESAYKHTVDKPHTGNGIAFYEEPGRISHRVDLDAIWTDAEYIPINAPEMDSNGFYSVRIGTLEVKVLQKLNDIPLDKVKGTKATYRSYYLRDAIFPSYGTGYSIVLTDWNGEVIPFGLNQWVIDPDNGEITFLGGWPEGYLETPRISFYKYVGRKANTSFLRSDGSIKMDNGYVPTDDQDIATKAYVDSMTGDVTDVVDKLIPTTPPTLEGANLKLEYARDIIASPWNSETRMPLVFHGEDYKIIIPQFYNPGKGEFHINVNGHDILDVDLSNITGPDIRDYWVVTSVVDPYQSSKVANNFYKSINSYITLPKSAIDSVTSIEVPYITIYCYTYYDFVRYETNPITIGFESKLTNPSISAFKVSNLTHESGNPIRYVSGVPTLKAGSSFIYNYNIDDLVYFKNDYISKFDVNNFQSDLIRPNSTYSSAHPTHIESRTITIPDNTYFEEIVVDINANNVALEDNVFARNSYNIRLDALSDESSRMESPENFSDPYIAQPWTDEDARTSLHNSSELQMLYGLYQWPTGNYTQIGNFESLRLEEDITLPAIVSGPNYSDIIYGVRYVTFSYEMPICNGFWISFENGQNIFSDKDTKAFKLSEFRCEVEGFTGWLDMSTPYEGVLLPRKNDDGCLVVAASTEDTKYITFGNVPLEGHLNITIGINKVSDIKFSGIKIVFNE